MNDCHRKNRKHMMEDMFEIKMTNLINLTKLGFWETIASSKDTTLIDDFVNTIIDFSNRAEKNGHGKGVFLEFPMLNRDTASQEGYYALITTHIFDSGKADGKAFENYFQKEGKIVTFPNISKDTILVVPNKLDKKKSRYYHIANYLRESPKEDIVALFKRVATEVLKLYNETNVPIYVSTHGNGVPWLHVRLCNSPKYYHFDM